MARRDRGRRHRRPLTSAAPTVRLAVAHGPSHVHFRVVALRDAAWPTAGRLASYEPPTKASYRRRVETARSIPIAKCSGLADTKLTSGTGAFSQRNAAHQMQVAHSQATHRRAESLLPWTTTSGSAGALHGSGSAGAGPPGQSPSMSPRTAATHWHGSVSRVHRNRDPAGAVDDRRPKIPAIPGELRSGRRRSDRGARGRRRVAAPSRVRDVRRRRRALAPQSAAATAAPRPRPASGPCASTTCATASAASSSASSTPSRSRRSWGTRRSRPPSATSTPPLLQSRTRRSRRNDQ